ncbi:MAG: nitronate monooxygenase [Hyphomicrobium sp.]|nr:nitronate monooxygenase [Hyphomicrobium sp.]
MSLIDRLALTYPIIQAPMAGSNDAELAIAVSEAGALGSLPAALMTHNQLHDQLQKIKASTNRPYNVNFFCHSMPEPAPEGEALWRSYWASHYERLGLHSDTPNANTSRAPFDAESCSLVEQHKPAVVSFHFGLPAQDLLQRVRATGAVILSTATTVAEARWLEANGVDIVIAQGSEAGGHRGMFLFDDLVDDIQRQPSTLSLVPQIVDAVRVPVIATGGIADGRGLAAALTLGAVMAQIGTAYLLCPEAKPTALHREALSKAGSSDTAFTNIFTGRPARGIINTAMRASGCLNRQAPQFPFAGNVLGPLRARAESQSDSGYSPLWAGQSVAMARPMPAAELTRSIAEEARMVLNRTARLV